MDYGHMDTSASHPDSIHNSNIINNMKYWEYNKYRSWVQFFRYTVTGSTKLSLAVYILTIYTILVLVQWNHSQNLFIHTEGDLFIFVSEMALAQTLK